MKGGKSKGKANTRLVLRKNATKSKKGKKATGSKKGKEVANKITRPPSAFSIFMQDFRKKYKEEHPHSQPISVVGDAGEAKWNQMSVAEKDYYERKASVMKDPMGIAGNIIKLDDDFSDYSSAEEPDESDDDEDDDGDEEDDDD